MAGKFSFQLESQDPRRALPHKIVIGQRDGESAAHVLLKLLAFVLFYRDRLQVEARLDRDAIPFESDVVQLDYQLQPVLWVECGECSVAKLDRLAVKVPEAAIWVLKRSSADAQALLERMARAGLRRDRYSLIGLDADMFDEMLGLLESRNRLFWVAGHFEPGQLQLDFNGLWFDAPFECWRF